MASKTADNRVPRIIEVWLYNYIAITFAGAPDDCDYFNEITPCNCELNEVCLRRDDGTFYCTCDLESRKLGSECVQISLPFCKY